MSERVNPAHIKHPLERWLSDDRVLLFNFWVADILFMSLKKEVFHIHWYEWVFSINSILLFITINYLLFPKFFEKGRVWVFLLLTFLAMCGTAAIEELVIERYFYYDPQAYPIASPSVVLAQYIPPVVIFILIKMMIYYRDRQILVDTLSKEKTESQLQFLKSQINPHILFNNLNNIYSLSIQEDKRTSDTILKLSNLMRYIVYESSENFVLLTKELEYLEDYLELQKIQLEGRGRVDFQLTGNSSGYTIAPLVLIPFVENAFKHSMDTQLDNIIIKIQIEIRNGQLFFSSTNSHDKSSKKSLSPTGIGLSNTKQRLQLLYPEKHTLNIEDSSNSYQVDLRIQLL
nr:sensor histidine kinase [uncultured Allomuricauda sp.]